MKRPAAEGWKSELYRQYWAEAELEIKPEENQLAHSRLMREYIKRDFGGAVPSSIWPFAPHANYEDPATAGRTRLEEASEEGGDMYAGQRALGGRLSVFEGVLARNLVRLYSNPGDTLLDPFAGRGARLAAALELGRKYVGFDPSEDAREACARMGAGREEDWTLHPFSSLFIDSQVEPQSMDCVITCPPYGSSEFYGDNGSGIEGNTSYVEFVEELAACLLQAAKALKPDRYLVVVIRGWHNNGHFLDVSAHLERYLSAAGLTLHANDVHKMSSSRERFHSDVVSWRRTAQVHEDVLVWQTTRPKKGTRDAWRKQTVLANTRRREYDEAIQRRREAVILEATNLGVHELPHLRPYVVADGGA